MTNTLWEEVVQISSSPAVLREGGGGAEPGGPGAAQVALVMLAQTRDKWEERECSGMVGQGWAWGNYRPPGPYKVRRPWAWRSKGNDFEAPTLLFGGRI